MTHKNCDFFSTVACFECYDFLKRKERNRERERKGDVKFFGLSRIKFFHDKGDISFFNAPNDNYS